MAYLRAHGIAVEVIPGVSAAHAAAASAGLPLTMRGVARRVELRTGHCCAETGDGAARPPSSTTWPPRGWRRSAPAAGRGLARRDPVALDRASHAGGAALPALHDRGTAARAGRVTADRDRRRRRRVGRAGRLRR
ncbi:MAG: hypothetical protein IPG96_07945 [Proteobacteria bacterium]|nr:hypothetical protein [Pseudomonadota bacterium]